MSGLKVQILGTGCAKCNKLYAQVEKAIAGTGVVAELSKVEKLEEIMTFGVVFTPALVIEGAVKVAGKEPSFVDIETWLKEAYEVS